ncbi:DNA polymerase III subunit delta [Chelatococcus sp. SYSU_G07232]|uniref:DNA polymerase III subunit delta n=1 Tax=Chelatococcus albus TaxID=3047466 RepID=A0ABT7AI91_9HYPH|nr:DNA polymerase III subunit delta [Chelatococcus sp. SYSU_G07232]MDJ1158707.1 DNA polymerase III subunit delta [Chelatococcus sp. SYSU_G07232]
MVAVKAGEVDAVLRRRDARIVVYLLYGPDTGLVGERAKALAEGAVEDPADPFQLVKLDGDAVAADPLRLADEANTVPLFGGRRAIWIKPTSRNLVPALSPLIAAPPRDAIVVIEAGELQRSSPLRTLCEKSPVALALPCYADEARDIAGLVDETMRAAGLAIGREAREMLVGLLGADRIATRNELAKLALYAHGRREVTAEDVETVVGDVSRLAIDAVVDSTFLGDLAALDRAFGRFCAEGMDAGVLLGSALRHALTLARARSGIDRGASPQAAVEGLRTLHFKRKSAVERQLRLWTSEALRQAVVNLGEAVTATRRNAALGNQLALKALWGLALLARRGGR